MAEHLAELVVLSDSEVDVIRLEIVVEDVKLVAENDLMVVAENDLMVVAKNDLLVVSEKQDIAIYVAAMVAEIVALFVRMHAENVEIVLLVVVAIVPTLVGMVAVHSLHVFLLN